MTTYYEIAPPRNNTLVHCVLVVVTVLSIGGVVLTATGGHRWTLRIGDKRLAIRIGHVQAPMASSAEEVTGELPVEVVMSSAYEYRAAPSLSKTTFETVICGYNDSPVCSEASAIYTLLVTNGFDPAEALAHMRKETEFGTTGIGRPGERPNASKGLYGADCNDDADWCTGGRPQSAFESYANATKAWMKMMDAVYISRGLTSPDTALPVYCPVSDGCDPYGYVETMHGWVDEWRALDVPAVPASAWVSSSTLQASGDFGTNVLAALNANNGAIQNFTIAPGDTWSFGHSIAPISGMGYLPPINGLPGAGWCNLGALYVEVADQLGLESGVPSHGAEYGPRFPGILLDENGNGADLTITNALGVPVTFRAIIEGDAYRIEAGT